MGAGVLQLAGLEEVLHGRFAVRAHHCLRIVIGDGWVLGRGGVSNLDHYHLALIAHDGSAGWRCCKRLGGQDGE